MWLRTVVCMAVMAVVCPLGAVDYYVDYQNGDDGNSGTSPDQPLQKFARVSAKLDPFDNAGTTIWLARGSEWTGRDGQIWLGNQITKFDGLTYDAYGTGPMPIINCAEVTNCVFLSDVDDITFRNIHIKGLRPDEGGVSRIGIYAITESSNLTVENCLIEHTWWYGIQMRSTTARQDGLWVRDSEFRHIAGSGVNYSTRGMGFEIVRNWFHDNCLYQRSESGSSEHGFTAAISIFGGNSQNPSEPAPPDGIGDGLIEYNLIENNRTLSGETDGNVGGCVWNDTTAGGNIIRFNVCRNNMANGITTEYSQQGGEIAHNFIDQRGAAWGSYPLFMARATVSWHVHDNAVLTDTRRGFACADFHGGFPLLDNVVEYNYVSGAIEDNWFIGNLCETPPNTFNGNCHPGEDCALLLERWAFAGGDCPPCPTCPGCASCCPQCPPCEPECPQEDQEVLDALAIVNSYTGS